MRGSVGLAGRLIFLTGDQQDRLFERILREPLAPRIEAARPFEQPVEDPAEACTRGRIRQMHQA